uniref:Uncharacterized protein n=1 Tax=Ditylenchus dipsaci TaxID=166011 RepID=A0A915ET37_9BILA
MSKSASCCMFLFCLTIIESRWFSYAPENELIEKIKTYQGRQTYKRLDKELTDKSLKTVCSTNFTRPDIPDCK